MAWIDFDEGLDTDEGPEAYRGFDIASTFALVFLLAAVVAYGVVTVLLRSRL